MADREGSSEGSGAGIWKQGGADGERLPDSLATVPLAVPLADSPPYPPAAGPTEPPAPVPAPPPSPPRRPRPSPRRTALYALAGLFGLMLVWLIVTAPLSRALEPLPDPAILLLSSEGQPIARRGAIKDRPVEIDELAPHTPAAFVAIEDRRFYGHSGIDGRAIIRAMLANLRAGEVRQGGSTITQQLAKTSFLSADRSVARKLQELIIALWIETWLSKDEILARYLSSVYFGDGVYGLRAAARHYFDRPPERLTLGQSAMLAGIVQAPSRLAPTRHLEQARKRGRLVLEAMVETGAISAGRAAATTPAAPVRKAERVPTGTYFADWVARAAQSAFERDFGEVRVRTTLDADLQRLAVRAVGDAPLGEAQVALVAMRPDGRVVAMIGGRSYKASAYNRATQARRQPGSAFKLFVYLAALRAGYRPHSLIDDAPIDIDGWKPANVDGRYRGRITLREAFARSSNAATVRLAQAVGIGQVIDTARELGVTGRLEDTPSLALGTSGVRLIELTAAYAAIAGGRYPVVPRGLAPGSGEGGPRPGAARRLDLQREWIPMLDLLWAAANEGTGHRAALAVPTFGKTGTSQGNRDALFIGFAGDLVVGVWVGRDDDRPLGEVSGGTVPAIIWRDFMRRALRIDGRASPGLPGSYRAPRIAPPPPPAARPQPPRRSPLPEEWSDPTRGLRQLADELDRLFGDR